MKRSLLLVPLAAAGLILGACSTQQSAAPPHPASAHAATAGPSTKVVPAPKAVRVPTNLVGKTVTDAKDALTKLGFIHVVVAGGHVTGSDPVASVPKAGHPVMATGTVVLVGQPARASTPAAPSGGTSGGTSPALGTDTAPGCGQRAVNSGQYNSSCSEYEGYLDPGTRAGRGQTSGETQIQHLCQQGLVSKEQC